jgi:glutamine synthetase
VAGPLVALNTILADSLGWIARPAGGPAGQRATASSEASFRRAAGRITREHGAVIFGGDGYSSEWHAHGGARSGGLENLRTSADALPVLQRA